MANVLLAHGVKKGDRVCIYMPMIPETAMMMLACARIGAVHSVVFGGFSAESLRDRIVDAGCKVVVTANEGMRGGKRIPLKRCKRGATARSRTSARASARRVAREPHAPRARWFGTDAFSPRLVQVPGWRARHLDEYDRALGAELAAARLHAWVDDVAPGIAALARADLAGWQPGFDWDAEVARLHTMIDKRWSVMRGVIDNLR